MFPARHLLRRRGAATVLAAVAGFSVLSACSSSGSHAAAGATSIAATSPATAGAPTTSTASSGVPTTVASSGVAGASSGPATGKLKSIEFVNPLPDYSQWKLIGQCMSDEAKKLGVQFIQTGPTGSTVDSNYMLARLQQGIANQVGALATFPVSAAQFTPVLQQAKSKGILTATLFGGGSTTVQNVEVGTNYVTAASEAADSVSKNSSGQVNVGIIVGTAVDPSKVWSDAFTAEAKKLPNVSVVTIAYDNGDPTKDVDITTNMLTAHPSINMIATNEGAASPGIDSAIKQKNDVGKVQFVGNGADAGGIAALNDGTAQSVLMQNLCAAGADVSDSLEGIHEGKPVPATVPVQIVYATKANYQGYLSKGGWL
jgi:ABC-type sugar transport system substrate-binding protein